MNRPDWIIKAKRIVMSAKTGDWCRIPYPNHPKGCPKYDKSMACPTMAPHISTIVNLDRDIYIVHSQFDLKAHMRKMKAKYPEWTELQCRCVLYWQSTSRDQLAIRIKFALHILQADASAAVPEAMGVNVYATCRLAGLQLEKIRGLKICRHVALIGWRQ